MDFGTYLDQALERAGHTQQSFADAVGQKRQAVHEVIQGKRAPPRKHLERWAEALGKAVDPKVFVELGLLRNSPPEIRKLVEDLRRKKA